MEATVESIRRDPLTLRETLTQIINQGISAIVQFQYMTRLFAALKAQFPELAESIRRIPLEGLTENTEQLLIGMAQQQGQLLALGDGRFMAEGEQEQRLAKQLPPRPRSAQ